MTQQEMLTAIESETVRWGEGWEIEGSDLSSRQISDLVTMCRENGWAVNVYGVRGPSHLALTERGMAILHTV
jgi:hypothetical protein